MIKTHSYHNEVMTITLHVCGRTVFVYLISPSLMLEYIFQSYIFKVPGPRPHISATGQHLPAPLLVSPLPGLNRDAEKDIRRV